MGSFYSKRSIVKKDVIKNVENYNLCVKCKKDMEEDNDFKFLKCKHKVHPKCLCEYLENFNTAMIKCPGQRCSQLIPDSVIRKCLSDVQIEKYDILSYSANTVKCLIRDCNYYFVAERRKGYFICEDCKQRNCLKCSNLHSDKEHCGLSPNKSLYEKVASDNLLKKKRENLLKLSEQYTILFNPEKSECELCKDFLLPREGIFINTCYHNFCRGCLEGHVNSVEIFARLKCPKCDTALNHAECRELLGAEQLESLNLNAVRFNFSHCKTNDCPYIFDPGTFLGLYKCPLCKKDNCISCNDIHEGLTCEEYQQTPLFKEYMTHEKLWKSLNGINCFNCGKTIIKDKGCGALKCDNCDKQVCAFLGKELGPNGCKCTKQKTCHKMCIYGCIPDGDTAEEDALRKYFNGN